MKLQLALDDITLDDAVELLDKVHTYVDIIEVGSPFIIEEGMRPVRIFKEKYPDCEILADTKIMENTKQKRHLKQEQTTVLYLV